jgi:hypothetical protein
MTKRSARTATRGATGRARQFRRGAWRRGVGLDCTALRLHWRLASRAHCDWIGLRREDCEFRGASVQRQFAVLTTFRWEVREPFSIVSAVGNRRNATQRELAGFDSDAQWSGAVANCRVNRRAQPNSADDCASGAGSPLAAVPDQVAGIGSVRRVGSMTNCEMTERKSNRVAITIDERLQHCRV